MKTYTIAKAGSATIGSIRATCITKACKHFIASLDRPAKYELYSREWASVQYDDNHCVMGDYVIQEA